MKRFIAKILLFILIVGAISICVNFVYMKRDHSDPQNVRKFQDMPSSIMVCNFGSSHGVYGFNYEELSDVECFNFAFSSQFPSYDKRLFDYYKDKISDGAVVFIPVSYFSIYGNSEITREDFLNKNKRYYHILPPKMIKEYDIKTDIYVHYLPSLSAGINLPKTLLLGSEYANDVNLSRVASDIDVKDDAKKACERHIFENQLDGDGNRIFNQEEYEALILLINECYEKECVPVLITTPYLREYTDEVMKQDPNFLDEFYSQMSRIVADTGVLYCDYGFDSRFVSNYDWFMNSDHLNAEGARHFTNILMEEVVHYGTDESLIYR